MANRGVYRRTSGPISPAEIEKNPWAFTCDQPFCYYSVSAKSEERALETQATHPCPWQGGTTTYHWSVTVTLVEQIWKKLDDDMLALKQPEAGADFVALKARMRAFAEVLAIFMTPHFTTADEIAREAVRRYDNRLNPEYSTAGLGQRRYEPPPGTPSYTPERSKPRATSTSTRSKPTSKLDDKEIESIRLFYKNGFPVEALAKAHGVSVAVINEIVAS